MRLTGTAAVVPRTLFAVAGALLVLRASAAPVGESGARVDVYVDDWITVVSPAARTRAEVADGVELEVRYALDALSGATQAFLVDGTTAATRFTERRHEGQVRGRVKPSATWSAGAEYAVSVEPDYLTHRVGADVQVEVMDRMATLSALWHLNLETLGMATDPGFAEETTTHGLDLAWTQILARRTSLTLQASGELSLCGEGHGCQASPYRFVPLLGDTGVVTALRERHPDRRLRGAGALRLAQGFGGGLALHAGYRFYRDGWQVTGHTTDAALVQTLFAERLVLRSEGRFTWQTAASFYRDDYGAAAPPAWRTADRELAGLSDTLAGLRAEAAWTDLGPIWRLTLNARAARLWYRYRDFAELPRRDAWLLGGGAILVW